MRIGRASLSLLAIVVSAFTVCAAGQDQLPQEALSPRLSSPAALQDQPDQGIADSILNGHYALVFSGYKNGAPIIMAGSVVADGAGHLTSGVLDVNDGSGEMVSNHNVVPQTLASGSVYSLTASRLGTMTIVTNQATFKFKVVVSPNACVPNSQFLSSCGRLIQSDPANPHDYGSGIIKVQDPQYFSVFTFFPGSFALQATGTNPSGQRYAAVGALATNVNTLVDIDCLSNWGIDGGCPLDVNNNGLAGVNPFRGTFAGTIDHITGRGGFVNLAFNNDPNGYCRGVFGSPGCVYAFYVIDKQQMVMISADPVSKPANLTLWWAVRQSQPPVGWTLAAVNAVSVMELTALDPNGDTPVPDITAGLFTSDGLGNASFRSDENHGGTMLQQQLSQGTYNIDSVGQQSGRVMLQGFNTQFGTTSAVIYLSAANTGFVLGTDAKVTWGVMEPQLGAPFTNASLVHTYVGGSVWPASNSAPNSAGTLFGDGAGNGSASQYYSGPDGPRGPILSILTYQIDSTGRGLVQQGDRLYGIAYVVSPTKVVLLPTTNAPALGVFASAPSN